MNFWNNTKKITSFLGKNVGFYIFEQKKFQFVKELRWNHRFFVKRVQICCVNHFFGGQCSQYFVSEFCSHDFDRRGEAVWAVTVETDWLFWATLFLNHSGTRVQLDLFNSAAEGKLGGNHRFFRKTSIIPVLSISMEYDISRLDEQ